MRRSAPTGALVHRGDRAAEFIHKSIVPDRSGLFDFRRSSTFGFVKSQSLFG